MKLKPLNDNILVELKNKYGRFGVPDELEGYQSGVVLEVPEGFPYFSSHAWTFENSLNDTETVKDVVSYYKNLVGRTVYWEQLSDQGVTIEFEGKKYALIKFTKLIALEEG